MIPVQGSRANYSQARVLQIIGESYEWNLYSHGP